MQGTIINIKLIYTSKSQITKSIGIDGHKTQGTEETLLHSSWKESVIKIFHQTNTCRKTSVKSHQEQKKFSTFSFWSSSLSPGFRVATISVVTETNASIASLSNLRHCTKYWLRWRSSSQPKYSLASSDEVITRKSRLSKRWAYQPGASLWWSEFIKSVIVIVFQSLDEVKY